MLLFGKFLCICTFIIGTSYGLEEDKERTPRIDLGDIAGALLGRAETNSQVLSLNLTNLVILLVLKGLLFGVTYMGAGHGKGRSLDVQDEPILSEPEILLLTSYLMGDAEKDYGCMYRIACQEPRKSKQYLNAAKLLLKGSKMFSDIIGYDDKYDELVKDMQEAIEFGTKYGTCHQKYSCNKNEGN